MSGMAIVSEAHSRPGTPPHGHRGAHFAADPLGDKDNHNHIDRQLSTGPTDTTGDPEKGSKYADSESGRAHSAAYRKAERKLLLKLGESSLLSSVAD